MSAAATSIVDTGFTGKQAIRWRKADPFPHLVIDDALPADLLAAAVAEIPAVDHPGWIPHRSRKFSLPDVAGFPNLAAVTTLLRSEQWLRHLSQLTGIRSLLADPDLAGGGVHRIQPGGRLGVHVDFNQHPGRSWVRRVNLLLYLNRKWRRQWNGALELHRDRKAVQIIEPIFNRMVLFESSERSWHGHPRPLTCPADRCRLSIADYYYTRGEVTDPHSTIYRDGK